MTTSPPPEETVSFVGGTGATLSGVLHRAVGVPKGAVLLAHCFSCGKDVRTNVRLAKDLARGGYAAFRFDFTGLGESGGAFEATSVSSNVSDLSRAAMTLIALGFGPCALVGHSLGGSAALLAAHRLKTVTSIVTIASPSSVDHVRHLFTDHESTIAAVGKAEVSLGGEPFCLGQTFLDDLEAHDVLRAARGLARPYLAIVAGNDTVVSPQNGADLVAAAGEGALLRTVEGADHLFSQRPHADALASLLLEFLNNEVDKESF